MINTGGEKIFPEEVEAALKTHPAVFDAVVVGVPDERFGEHVAALVVVARRLRTRSSTVAAGALPHRSSPATRCPKEIHVVDAIQRTPAGKPDYRWAKAAPPSCRGAQS